jgi:hypothetical protein
MPDKKKTMDTMAAFSAGRGNAPATMTAIATSRILGKKEEENVNKSSMGVPKWEYHPTPEGDAIRELLANERIEKKKREENEDKCRVRNELPPCKDVKIEDLEGMSHDTETLEKLARYSQNPEILSRVYRYSLDIPIDPSVNRFLLRNKNTPSNVIRSLNKSFGVVCTQCGYISKPGLKKCSSCGAKLSYMK